jgi:Cu-Zn family superoxide dismutase
MTRPLPPSRAALAAALLAAFAAGCDRNAEAPAAAAPPVETPAATPPATPEPAPAATAIANVTGEGIEGQLTLTGEADAVHVTGQLTGLPPDSEHGFHVHDTGDCSAFATGSAGSHFNPDQNPHAGPDAPVHHAGDLPNQRADATGTLAVDVRIPGVGLATRDDHDVLGRALVVHEGADDYSTQPSGGSGTPVACGVIEMPAETPPPAAP